MRVKKLNLPKKIENGDIVESHSSGAFYLIVNEPRAGYSVVELSSSRLYTTTAETPEEAVNRLIAGGYTVHKPQDFEIVLN